MNGVVFSVKLGGKALDRNMFISLNTWKTEHARVILSDGLVY